ncbi:hypothetical protein EV690_3285 [Celerinatantimonas diazotrophica]|uniref:Peptidase inhibitor I9 n=2 Tax=Celerinatantimonas diazotrophica TaxID=412034 RepID=A0A4R1J9C4_9GAMM|nr:hypothetical protein EV690_3285 [Celerinatantimonas diazotrophica]CAG9295401.1 hypothetical protein CEDIAZO_00517 [Celerinatantimonas diazotrophica]
MNIHRYKISLMFLALFPFTFLVLTSTAQADPQHHSNHAVKIDPLLTILLHKRAKEHIVKPVVASVLLKENSAAVLEQIRQSGASVISHSKNYPLLTIGLESTQQLHALAHIEGIEQIHSVYPSVGDSDFDPGK